MVYLLKMVIFHGYVTNNQMVLRYMAFPGASNGSPLTQFFLRRSQPRSQSILELSSGASHKSPGAFDVDGLKPTLEEKQKIIGLV